MASMLHQIKMPPDFMVSQLMILASGMGKEVSTIATDVFHLLPDGSSDKLIRLLRENLEKNYFPITGNNGFRISKFNQLELEEEASTTTDSSSVGQGYYANPLTGEVVLVDFRPLVTTHGGLGIQKVNELFDLAAQNKIISDIKAYFACAGSADMETFSSIFETDNDNTCVIVTGISEHMEVNYWSVQCACVWTVERVNDSGDPTYTLTGEISGYVHYYESCNFHYSFPKIKVKRISNIASIEKIFLKIKSKILKVKSKLHGKIFLPADMEDVQVGGGQTACLSTGAAGPAPSSGAVRPSPSATPAFAPQPVTVLKKLRRPLPIHKTKFYWNLHKVMLLQNLG